MQSRCILRGISSRTSALLMAAVRTAPAQSARRFAATTAAGSQDPSPVNQDDFTLNENVVQKHVNAMEKWRVFGQKLTSFRKQKRHDLVLSAVREGDELTERLGLDNSPFNVQSMLRMEAAQAHYNLQNFTAALTEADAAEKILLAVEQRDFTQLADIKEFRGFVFVSTQESEKAEAVFRELLEWIDRGCRNLAPMITVAARNMRRTVAMGLGMALEQKAAKESGSTAREIYSAALDPLIGAMQEHIEAADLISGKKTLDAARRCYIGLKDGKQAFEACEKMIAWCNRFGDTDGVEDAKAKREGVQRLFEFPAE